MNEWWCKGSISKFISYISVERKKAALFSFKTPKWPIRQQYITLQNIEKLVESRVLKVNYKIVLPTSILNNGVSMIER